MTFLFAQMAELPGAVEPVKSLSSRETLRELARRWVGSSILSTRWKI